MAPKKHNAFMMFVHEWRNKNGRKMTIPQAVHQCGEIWMNMNPQQRGPYNASAKKSDVAERCKVERLNCHGQPLSMVEREERQAAEQHMQMKRSIERMVLNGKAQHDLENTKFIFAAFNYFTKAIGNDIYIPAEFAACQFSLKSGIISLYSSHINPGQLIFGQASDAQHHTSTTHQLPLPPNAMGESNMGRLYGAIIEYLRGCYRRENPNEPLAVFTSTELIPVVEGCLRYVESDTEEPMEKIHVYDIQYLFYVLKKEVMDIADLPQDKINKSITDNLFLNDFFEYQSGISCQFHEDNDRSKYCAHSMVTRWCYVFSDYMCGDLAIKPLPGKHMPPKQEPMFRVTNPELSSVDYTSSLTSLSSVKTEVKREPDYVPADHSAFTADLSGVRDFPALGGHRSTRSREHCRNNMPSNDAKDVWNVPSTNRCVRDLEDAFNMPRR